MTPYNVDLNPENALDIAMKYDLILDCTDNVPTRYMLNDVSVLTKVRKNKKKNLFQML